MDIFVWKVKTGVANLKNHIFATKTGEMAEALEAFKRQNPKEFNIRSIEYVQHLNVID